MTLAIPIVIVLALAVVALYPVLRESIRRRRTTVPDYVEALRLIVDGDDRQAIGLLKEAVKADSENVDAWVRLGDAYVRVGEVERGIRIHENLGLRRNLRPEDERRVLTALARDYERTDRKLKAIATLEELARTPDPEAAGQLLRLYLATDSHGKCRNLLDELRRGGADTRWLAQLTAEYARGIADHDPDAAREAFDECLRLDSGSVHGRLYYGDFLFGQGKPDEALSHWQQVIEKAPRSNVLVRSRLERAYYELGRYDEIVSTYERLLSRVPEDTGLAVALALILRKKQNHDEAVRLLVRTCGDREDALCQATRAALELDRGRTDEALQILDRLIAGLRVETEGGAAGPDSPAASL